MSHKVAVIEDDEVILRGLVDNLKFEGYQPLPARDAESGYKVIHERGPELIILDLMLPRMNGYELCRKLRKEGVGTPILMLTARGQEMDRVMGLDLGADDYVVKPFLLSELLARVRALLRRTRPVDNSLPDRLEIGGVEIDFQRYEARQEGRPLPLTRKEFSVLRLLASRSGKAMTREELLNEAWGYESYPTTRTVDNHIASLRAKLEANPERPKHLLTVHGVGYRLAL
jgi:DNA-binding response OmpR family regulator